MGRWDKWQIYKDNVEASISELRAMSQRMELVKDVVVQMADTIEAIKRELETLRQKRKALDENNEIWAMDMKAYLDVLIEDHSWIATDLKEDLGILTDGHIPEGYKYNRRGRTNLNAA